MSLYEQVLEALQEAAETSNTGFVFRKQSLVSCFRRATSAIEFDCYLLLRDWRWRPTTAKERVEILVHAQEEISDDAVQLNRSTVRVTYYLVNANNLAPLHTVHFDYGRMEPCHPAFHVQVAADPVVLPDTDRTELECDFAFPQQTGSCFQGARIPTADMTLSSVLLCLAADHIGGAFFSEFRAKLREIQQRMPQPVFAELRASIAAEPNNLRSFHWFAHMPA
jgi:hypothetical protein